MRLDLFDFPLAEEQVALRPHYPRDHAQLLVITPNHLYDQKIYDLPDWLDEGDVLVMNDSPTMRAQLIGEGENGKKIEILFCAPSSQDGASQDGASQDSVGQEGIWQVMAKGRLPETIFFGHNGQKQIIATKKDDDHIRLNITNHELAQFLQNKGMMPLPPYIRRQREVDDKDCEDYQTIYHRKSAEWGSIAAPTAGLHWTPALFDALHKKGVEIIHLTLHVGQGTFLPVRSGDINDHHMQAERVELTASAARHIDKAKQSGKKIIAVGTTSLRVIESAVNDKGAISAFKGESSLFIKPGYRFQIADGLITNFHLPKSTPLMLVAAMIGLERIKEAYAHAVQNHYRFFSYGDACLILP